MRRLQDLYIGTSILGILRLSMANFYAFIGLIFIIIGVALVNLMGRIKYGLTDEGHRPKQLNLLKVVWGVFSFSWWYR